MRWLGPWSASSGAQSSPSATPPPRRRTVDDARSRRLFGDDVLKAGPRKYGEDAVVQGQEGQVAAGVFGNRCSDASDQHRQRDGQKEDGQQELARPRSDRHRREQRWRSLRGRASSCCPSSFCPSRCRCWSEASEQRLPKTPAATWPSWPCTTASSPYLRGPALSTSSPNSRLLLASSTVLLLGGGVALGLLWAPEDADQGPSQRIFYVHVPIALTAYAMFGW